jgi:hypothetical protein
VIVKPYAKDSDYHMVLGEAPQGATVVRGEKSAYRTAKMLTGKPPSKPVLVDSGFQDITIRPSGRKIALRFTPDPKGQTEGDITIGQRNTTRITEKAARIGTQRGRITPKRPRIGR